MWEGMCITARRQALWNCTRPKKKKKHKHAHSHWEKCTCTYTLTWWDSLYCNCTDVILWHEWQTCVRMYYYFLWWGQKLFTVPRQGVFPAFFFIFLLCESSGEINTERNIVVTVRTLRKDILCMAWVIMSSLETNYYTCLRLLLRDKLNHLKMCQTECHTSEESCECFCFFPMAIVRLFLEWMGI